MFDYLSKWMGANSTRSFLKWVFRRYILKIPIFGQASFRITYFEVVLSYLSISVICNLYSTELPTYLSIKTLLEKLFTILFTYYFFRNRSMILLVIAYALSQGIQEGFMPVLNIDFTPLGIKEVRNFFTFQFIVCNTNFLAIF